MDSKSYLTLNSWLQKSDGNYISGRFLWLNYLIVGASNLLWLSCEQIIKILLLQKEIDRISLRCRDSEEMHKECEKKGKKFGHDVDDLIKKLNNQYPGIDLNKYEHMLAKLNEYFWKRYVINEGSSISLDLLTTVDEFYFELRAQIESDVGLGTIDEIFIQRKHNLGHPIAAFAFAYKDNNSFQPRKHRPINISGPDGKIYEETGM